MQQIASSDKFSVLGLYKKYLNIYDDLSEKDIADTGKFKILTGKGTFEGEYKFGDRIKQMPYVQRKKHFANVAQCDINLAPLEYNNPFCEAKSELKFFESGIVKVPVVAVNNETYRDAIEDGKDGFLAGNTDEWVGKLSQLIDNRNLRLQMGLKAYQKTIKIYTIPYLMIL